MAKRFTDTDKWKMAWFRKLGTQGRDIFNYLYDNCDFAGFFELDVERMSFELGFEVDLNKIKFSLKEKLIVVTDDRLFLPAFVDFQYGELSEDCKPHIAVIKKLKSQRVWEKFLTLRESAPKSMDTLKDKDKDKEKDKEKDKDQEKETEKEKEEAEVPKKITSQDIELCKNTWIETLRFFKAGRSLLVSEENYLGRAALTHGVKATCLALEGARFEAGGDGYNPAEHLNLFRILDHQKFQKFLNLGVQARNKINAKASSRPANPQEDEIEYADPSRVKEIIAGAFKRIPKGVA